MVSRTEGNIDDSLVGGNGSAEGPEGEGTESTVITGVDITMNHHLQETSFTKEAYKKYIKDSIPFHSIAQSCPTLCDPVICSLLGFSVHGILQARILGLPFPSPGDLPDPGIEPGSPALEADALTSEPPGKPHIKDYMKSIKG
uniref:Translationally-controlled tumor protein n=1 Tax=Moschus moschiferus TaxID=68415 RepID=A0A8C6FPU7_MOSMO